MREVPAIATLLGVLKDPGKPPHMLVLLVKSNFVILVIPSDQGVGIVECRLLKARFRVCSLLSKLQVTGSVPLNTFSCRFSDVKLVRVLQLLGTVPFI